MTFVRAAAVQSEEGEANKGRHHHLTSVQQNIKKKMKMATDSDDPDDDALGLARRIMQLREKEDAHGSGDDTKEHSGQTTREPQAADDDEQDIEDTGSPPESNDDDDEEEEEEGDDDDDDHDDDHDGERDEDVKGDPLKRNTWSTGQKKGAWSAAEDAHLVSVLSKIKFNVKGGSNSSWSQVARHVKGRSAKQCRERWCYNLDPSIKKSEWTRDEDRTLMTMHRDLGNRWAQIAQALPGRTENSVKTRYKSLLRAKRREWTPAEDRTILSLHSSYGCRWGLISNSLKNRTKNAVKTRCRALMRGEADTVRLSDKLGISLGSDDEDEEADSVDGLPSLTDKTKGAAASQNGTITRSSSTATSPSGANTPVALPKTISLHNPNNKSTSGNKGKAQAKTSGVLEPPNNNNNNKQNNNNKNKTKTHSRALARKAPDTSAAEKTHSVGSLSDETVDLAAAVVAAAATKPAKSSSRKPSLKRERPTVSYNDSPVHSPAHALPQNQGPPPHDTGLPTKIQKTSSPVCDDTKGTSVDPSCIEAAQMLTNAKRRASVNLEMNQQFLQQQHLQHQKNQKQQQTPSFDLAKIIGLHSASIKNEEGIATKQQRVSIQQPQKRTQDSMHNVADDVRDIPPAISPDASQAIFVQQVASQCAAQLQLLQKLDMATFWSVVHTSLPYHQRPQLHERPDTSLQQQQTQSPGPYAQQLLSQAQQGQEHNQQQQQQPLLKQNLQHFQLPSPSLQPFNFASQPRHQVSSQPQQQHHQQQQQQTPQGGNNLLLAAALGLQRFLPQT